MVEQPFKTCRVNKKGLSVIELLVAGVIGLILLAGVVQIYINSRQAYKLNEAMAEVQENGAFAMALIETQLRMAGFRADAVYNRDVTFDADGTTFDQGQGIKGTNNGGENGSDLVRVRFQGDKDDTTRDCVGNGVAAGDNEGTDPVKVEFTVAVSATNNPASIPGLHCRTAASNYEIVRGVENLQVLYGEDTAGSSTKSASRYVGANQITDWSRVASVRVGILVRSSEEVLQTADSSSYTLAGAVSVPQGSSGVYHPGGRYLRRVFNSTYQLRNLSYF